MIWGWQDMDILPVRFFVVARDIGGQILGAFDDSLCADFASCRRQQATFRRSHMLGVLPESHRNAGVGRMLKLAQRDDAIARGFFLIEWTFDPLELKNAYFNIEKLGAIIRRYLSQSLRDHLLSRLQGRSSH